MGASFNAAGAAKNRRENRTMEVDPPGRGSRVREDIVDFYIQIYY
jgi:hypothetical protein